MTFAASQLGLLKQRILSAATAGGAMPISGGQERAIGLGSLTSFGVLNARLQSTITVGLQGSPAVTVAGLASNLQLSPVVQQMTAAMTRPVSLESPAIAALCRQSSSSLESARFTAALASEPGCGITDSPVDKKMDSSVDIAPDSSRR